MKRTLATRHPIPCLYHHHTFGLVLSLLKMPPFNYEALDLAKRSIRLLQIQAGSTEEPICCELAHSDLDEHPKFIALSYTWDRGDKHRFVKCNGVDFQVGINLWNFIDCYSRSDDRGVLLWFDAICEHKYCSQALHWLNLQQASIKAIHRSVITK